MSDTNQTSKTEANNQSYSLVQADLQYFVT